MQVDDTRLNPARKYTSQEERKRHVENWKISGLGMREYCRQNNLSLSSLSTWKKACNSINEKFKPVKIVSSAASEMQPYNVVEILLDQRIKIKLQHVTDVSFIIAIAKGLI